VPGYGAGHLNMEGNLGAYIDRSLMHTNHLWFWGGQMWDPEGLLSTLPATANMLLGILAGALLQSSATRWRKVAWLFLGGIVLMLAGIALNPLIPINKKIWTPSFMLFSGGFSLLVLALLHRYLDTDKRDTGKELQGWRRTMIPFLVFGSNAILGFSLAQMLNPLFGMAHIATAEGKTVDIPGFCFSAFVRVLSPWNASLAYAILFVLLHLLLLWPLYSKRIWVRL
jgi:predicted acyltransferase